MEKFIEILLLLDNPIFYDSYTNTLIYFKFYKHSLSQQFLNCYTRNTWYLWNHFW